MTFVLGRESSTVLSLPGAKVPGSESSTYGTSLPGAKARGNESSIQGRSQRGGHGWMSPRHGLKNFLAPECRWLLCHWCHTPDVAETKRKCAISTSIFRKFSGGYAPDPHTGEGLRRPSPGSSPLGAPALRASAPRSGPSVPPSSCPPLQKSWLRAWFHNSSWLIPSINPGV